jgi:hypothetical protein
MTAFLKAELLGPRVWTEAERAGGASGAEIKRGSVSPLASVDGWARGPEYVFDGGCNSTIFPI